MRTFRCYGRVTVAWGQVRWYGRLSVVFEGFAVMSGFRWYGEDLVVWAGFGGMGRVRWYGRVSLLWAGFGGMGGASVVWDGFVVMGWFLWYEGASWVCEGSGSMGGIRWYGFFFTSSHMTVRNDRPQRRCIRQRLDRHGFDQQWLEDANFVISLPPFLDKVGRQERRWRNRIRR